MRHLRDAHARNGGGDLYIYWQVTRGAERGRNHAPLPDIPRTVFAFCTPLPVAAPAVFEKGVACVTAQDTRWAHCDIKSIALLANVLLRQLAVDANAAETILLRNGELMEASASAVHVVIGGELRAPPNSRKILPGTTRGAVEELAARLGCRTAASTSVKPSCAHADEIWISAATREVQPVTTLDGKRWARGVPARCGGGCMMNFSVGSRSCGAAMAMTDPPPLLEFPTDYPIKVIGRPSDEFRARVHAIVLRHAPLIEPERVTERLSENGNFLSISYRIRAESREQMEALAIDLKSCEGVLTLI